jgi:hypothetical protein
MRVGAKIPRTPIRSLRAGRVRSPDRLGRAWPAGDKGVAEADAQTRRTVSLCGGAGVLIRVRNSTGSEVTVVCHRWHRCCPRGAPWMVDSGTSIGGPALHSSLTVIRSFEVGIMWSPAMSSGMNWFTGCSSSGCAHMALPMYETEHINGTVDAFDTITGTVPHRGCPQSTQSSPTSAPGSGGGGHRSFWKHRRESRGRSRDGRSSAATKPGSVPTRTGPYSCPQGFAPNCTKPLSDSWKTANIGAQEKTRTSTTFRPQVPETCASTNSATWATVAHTGGPSGGRAV